MGAIATASGQAALHLAIVTLMGAGSHIVASRSLYGGSHNLLHFTLRRFGIETTYRQKNQARGFTTSPSPGYRLLLEGLGHLIRQVWVLLTEQIAGPRQTGWVHQLPLAVVIEWLDDALRDGLAEAREIPVAGAT